MQKSGDKLYALVGLMVFLDFDVLHNPCCNFLLIKIHVTI